MTAAEYLSLAAELAEETTLVTGITEQQRLRGLTGFDYNAPLPPLNIAPARASWEPAARHYRDLSSEERASQ